MPPGPAPKGQSKLTRDEMRVRDEKILRMFIAGASEYEISRSVGVTRARVNQILKREIARGSRHRELLRDEALATYISRSDVLLRSCWSAAMAGDLRAIETARHVIEAQAKAVMGSATVPPPIPETEDAQFDPDDPDDVNELERYRRQRSRRRGDY